MTEKVIVLPRVLHVGPLPFPLGGVAVALQMILRCQALYEFDNRVFNVSDNRLTEVVGSKRLTIRRIVRRIKLAINVARRVQFERPNIIHLQCGSESALDIIGYLLVLWASSIIGSRIILHLHVNPAVASLPGRKRYGQWLFRQLIRPSHALFTLTDDYRNHLISCSLRQPVYTVPNMCDESLLNLSVNRNYESGFVNVIFLGRLSFSKGIFDLLQVAARLRTEDSHFRFKVAGQPSLPEEARLIKEFCKQKSLYDTVQFLGFVTDAAKLHLFKHGDIVVIPSRSESFGIVAIEAMAAGLPVIGTKVAGLSSIIMHSETGYLVEPGDVESIIQYLVHLKKNKNLIKHLGYAGRKRFLTYYSASQVGSLIAEAYRDILYRKKHG
jgi:glycosyltransferase involved in cell wall biosynthesis